MQGFVKSVLGAIVSIGLVFGAAGVSAMGSGGGSKPSGGNQKSNYEQAVSKVKALDYPGAIALLKQVVAADPKNADALNYLGFSYRETNDLKSALSYYQKALAINPNHKGANEYLGELYVRLGDLTKAREQLAILDKLCSFGCTEYEELKSKVAALGKKRGS